jgi:serine/threonine protein kinase/Flp pilus assembly protein TadD
LPENEEGKPSPLTSALLLRYSVLVSARMIGQTISHYRVLAKLGQGGMGAVYRAEDLILNREVALKFLPPSLAGLPDARARLLKEAQTASRLNHPNIATIYELNLAGDQPFISMELVSGRTLKDLLQHSAVPPATFPCIARGIAEGLLEAHNRGVFHHDIKPANVMLDSRSCVKILDFGLSELVRMDRSAEESEETFITRTSTQNVIGGTVGYMSPERILGQAADGRSDIFSFGVLLYECITGCSPFPGETTIDVLHAVVRAPYIPVRQLVSEVDPAWEALVDACLVKSPAQRCSSMQKVIESLDRLSAPSQRPEKSIAVLYFANLSGDREDEYFRDGMTEDIITELTRIAGLSLLPRSAVLPFRDKPVTAGEIGRQLNVAYVLDGSLRRVGNRLRINTQLVETRTGHSVWAERYDRQLEDVFAIQDEIAQNIAGTLRVMLTDKERRAIEKIPTRDIQAYDYYLRGRRVFYELRRKSFEFARQMFARAIVIDPGYAAAFAGVADSSSFLYMWFDATEDNLREAAHASRRAVELDPDSAEAHAARGLAESLRKNYQEAEKEFKEAMQLNPRFYDAAYLYGRCSFAQGKMEEAAALFRRASELDPADYQSLNHLQMCLRALGQDDEARAVSKAALERTERHIEMYPEDARALYLGASALHHVGDRERALKWAARALAIDPDENSTLYNVACLYAQLGDRDRALDLIETTIRNGFGHREWIENDIDLASLRNEPRFKSLLQLLSERKK